MACALFDRYPELRGALPHLCLGQFPTAMERLPGLLPRQVELWIKREDQSGVAYGGNKVRKLEFLLAAARAGQRLLTFGGYGSHHVLATAIYGRALGHSVDAVVFPQPKTAHAVDTVRLSLAAGAELFPGAGYLDVPRQLGRALLAHRGAPLLIGPGGSSPRGTLGWLSGGLEIGAQVAAGLSPRFDAVYAALGSGGTVAGLWLGLGEAAAELVAVRVVPWIAGNGPHCLRLGRRTAALLQRHLPRGQTLPPPPPLRVDGRFFAPGYGTETTATRDALLRAADAGLALDPTYMGRTVAALLSDAAAGRLDGKRVLLLHSYSSRDLSALRATAATNKRLPPRLRAYVE